MHDDEPIPGWNPTDDVLFILDDKTGLDRTPDQLRAFLDSIKFAANQHGFDINRWCGWKVTTGDDMVAYEQHSHSPEHTEGVE